MKASWPRAESAWRRAWRSPRLARVISFSSSGLTALALASVVLIRSCSMTSLERFASSALRCAGSRLSLCRLRWWRMSAGSSASVLAQAQPASLERLDDLVDRLLAKVGDRIELRLGLRDQIADGLDAGALEAVVGTHAQLELLDQDPPLLALEGERGSAAGTGEASVE